MGINWCSSIRVYRFTGTLAFVGIVVLAILGVTQVKPALEGLNLKPATCTVLSSSIGDTQECSCGRSCRSTFPCLTIYVNYTPKGQDKNVSNVQLFETVYEKEEDDLHDMFECSTRPCHDFEETNQDMVNDFKQRYGRPGQQYTCYYNYKNTKEVVTTTGNFKMVIVNCIVWPSLLTLSMIGVMVGYYCYKNKNNPNDGMEAYLI